jgi:hypothetical protein
LFCWVSEPSFLEGFSEQAVGAVLGPWVNPAGGREGRLE